MTTRLHHIALLGFVLFSAGCDGPPPSPDSQATVQAPAPTEALLPEQSPDDPEGPAAQPDVEATRTTRASAEVPENGPGDEAPGVVDSDTGVPPRLTFERPEHVRGIYLNAWAAGSSKRSGELTELAQRTEINSFVIDLKDATGYISHRTEIPLAHEIGATGEIRIRDVGGLLARLHAAGIYPIARIVLFKDPIISKARPSLAVQDTAGGVWIDGKGQVWVNPNHREVWDYNVALAREAADLGFPEIQWDYVRFPDAPRSELDRATFPASDGRTKAETVRAFLGYAREQLADLDVELTADVFGVSTVARRDVGIGQLWELMIDRVDVALPMVYPSHYWRGSYGFQQPNGHPYEIVYAALKDAVERSAVVDGAGQTRPWLQDFTLGSPRYEGPEVRAQIEATYDAGIQEWILWNPGGRYTESALAPAGGYPEGMEPWIRYGGEIILASERPDPAALADGAVAGSVPSDSVKIAPDTLSVGPHPR